MLQGRSTRSDHFLVEDNHSLSRELPTYRNDVFLEGYARHFRLVSIFVYVDSICSLDLWLHTSQELSGQETPGADCGTAEMM